LEQLRRVCTEIAGCLPGRSRRLIVAVRSTVLPGTCEGVVAAGLGNSAQAAIVSNPEFLREGGAVRDFMEPSLVVVGGAERDAVDRVAGLYAPLGVEPCRVSLRTAEMIKYACNSFHALKVAFANEIGALGAELGIDAAEVMATLCRDVRLNISPAYLKPGFAFGGSCLPKDLRALVHRAGRLDLKLPLLESILPSNQSHLDRALQAVLDLPVERIGVFGLSFKENTDDLRESPVVELLEQLIGKGRDLRVFDPQIQLDRIYGSNERFIFSAIPHISKLLQADFEETLKWAQHLVVAQKPAGRFTEAIRRSGIAVLDLVGAFPEAVPAGRLTRGAA
jgi:GDP-mannose 6-dehydrogenase